MAGSFSDRYGRHWPLMIGLATYAIASILCAVAPSIWVLLLARYVQGAAGGAGVVIARATVRDLHEGVEAASTALALTSYPRAAGSASALLGLAQFATGAIAAPLVGIAGEDTAAPMAIIIAVASSGALLAFRTLSRPS